MLRITDNLNGDKDNGEIQVPGDFRTVRQSLFYLGGTVSNETRLNELEKESSLKKNTQRQIGF